MIVMMKDIDVIGHKKAYAGWLSERKVKTYIFPIELTLSVIRIWFTWTSLYFGLFVNSAHSWIP